MFCIRVVVLVTVQLQTTFRGKLLCNIANCTPASTGSEANWLGEHCACCSETLTGRGFNLYFKTVSLRLSRKRSHDTSGMTVFFPSIGSSYRWELLGVWRREANPRARVPQDLGSFGGWDPGSSSLGTGPLLQHLLLQVWQLLEVQPHGEPPGVHLPS